MVKVGRGIRSTASNRNVVISSPNHLEGPDDLSTFDYETAGIRACRVQLHSLCAFHLGGVSAQQSGDIVEMEKTIAGCWLENWEMMFKGPACRYYTQVTRPSSHISATLSLVSGRLGTNRISERYLVRLEEFGADSSG